jgi:hypothetical protein
MDCNEAIHLISAEIDGEGEPGGKPALDDHLTSCPACREARESLVAQDGELRRLFTTRREAARELAVRVVADLRRTSPGARVRSWFPIILSAAAGFLFAAFIFYRPQATPQPTPGAGMVKAPPSGTGAPAAPGEKVSPEPSLDLALSTGVVDVQAPGQSGWAPASQGSRFPVGTRVRTGGKVLCEFRTPDGSEVRLNGDTELVFRSARRIELARGQVFSSVAHDPEPYLVEVPSHQAAVKALGTRFDIQCKVSETVLTVVEGVTQVAGREGKELGRIEVGETAKIVQGRLTEKNKVGQLELATRWINEILALKGPDNEEFKKRIDSLMAQLGETKMSYLCEEEIVALGDHCVVPLSKFIQSDLARNDQAKRINAARILQKIAPRWAAGELIRNLENKEPEVRYWMAKALERLTRESRGLKPEDWRNLPQSSRQNALKEWQEWWDENRENLESFRRSGPK